MGLIVASRYMLRPRQAKTRRGHEVLSLAYMGDDLRPGDFGVSDCQY